MDPATQVPASQHGAVLLGQTGHLWAALADQLLIACRAVRHAASPARRELRIAVPRLADTPLYRHSTRRFDYSLGERDIGPISLATLLERFLEAGGSVNLLTRAPLDGGDPMERQSWLTIERLAAFAPRFNGRTAALDCTLVVGPGFAFISSSGLFQRGDPAGDAGLLLTAPETQRELSQSFDLLWRRATPLVGGRAG